MTYFRLTLTRTLAIGLAVSVIALSACRAKPFQTLVRGVMSIDGDMGVNGDMNVGGNMSMDGSMKMSGDVSASMKTDNTASRLVSIPVYTGANPDTAAARRIAVLDVDGLLLNKNISGFGSLGENPVALFREKLDMVATDPSVAALVLRINSPGGGVTATDVMTRDLQQVKAQLKIPVVACIMDVGAGGGYYLATAADVIVAHPTSLVGGVGVILNVYNLEDGLGQFGVVSIPIKAGERIDVASPERMMEAEERALLQEIADSFHERFKTRVAAARVHLESKDILDGRVMTGGDALEYGLVDQLGYLDDAVVLARQLSHAPENTPLVMFRRDNDRAYTLLDVTPNTPTTSSILPLKMPGLDRSSLPTFLYMWQPEPSMVSSGGG
ncbi:MAG: S49 family peptidase [Pirellulaceae bacterium]